jgi:hypothetical protein
MLDLSFSDLLDTIVSDKSIDIEILDDCIDTETLDCSTDIDTLNGSLSQARLSLYGFSQREANTLQLARISHRCLEGQICHKESTVNEIPQRYVVVPVDSQTHV